MKFSLRRFFSFGLSALAITSAIAAGTFLYSIRESYLSTKMLEAAVESVATAQHIQQNLSIHRRQALLQKIRSESDRTIATESAKKQLLSEAFGVSRFATTEAEKASCEKIQQDVLSYLHYYDSLRAQGVRTTDLYREITERYDATQSAIQELINYNLKLAQSLRAKDQLQNQVYEIFIFCSLVLLITVIAVMLFAFKKFLYRPFLTLKQRIDTFTIGEKFGTGELGGATELQEIADSFKELGAKLALQKNQQLTFLSSIAHDLKNPLSAIKMSAEIISEEKALSKDATEILTIICRQTDHMKRLTEDLLDTTQIESGHFKLEFTPCNLSNIIKDAATLLSNLSPRHQIKIILPAEPLDVLGDQRRLAQVLNNLMTNAIKYSPAGGEICIMGKKVDGLVKIEIQDSGLGIDPNELESIFEAFERSKTTKNAIPGVGLGLSVSRKIIRAHECGEIFVRSMPGKGSVFALVIKALEDSSINLTNEAVARPLLN